MNPLGIFFWIFMIIFFIWGVLQTRSNRDGFTLPLAGLVWILFVFVGIAVFGNPLSK